jgi:hypothetical protein
MMSNLFLRCQHTIRFAATHKKEVAVSKREAKSAGVHPGADSISAYWRSQAGKGD